MHDSELIRCYTDRAGMFVIDLIKVMLTSLTPRWNAIAPEMDITTTLTTLIYKPDSKKLDTVQIVNKKGMQ